MRIGTLAATLATAGLLIWMMSFGARPDSLFATSAPQSVASAGTAHG